MKHTRPTITSIVRQIKELENQNREHAEKLFSGTLSPENTEFFNRMYHDNLIRINLLKQLIGE